MNKKNRIISLFLSFLLIIGLFPLEALADGNVSGEGSGDGTGSTSSSGSSCPAYFPLR